VKTILVTYKFPARKLAALSGSYFYRHHLNADRRGALTAAKVRCGVSGVPAGPL
jgi:hypothetical protein